MVDPEIQRLASQFVRSWDALRHISPVMRLDYSWPSVGVIDAITYRLRGENLEQANRENLLKGAAAYLSILTASAWEAAGVSATVRDSEQGIMVYGYSAPFQKAGEVFCYPLENALLRLLRISGAPIPVLAGYHRPVPPDFNFLSLWMLGVVTGLVEDGEGTWCAEVGSDRQELVQKVVRFLGIGSANYFGAVFPENNLGQLGELYLEQLIYPPTGFEEGFPACGAVPRLARFFSELGLGSAELVSLGRDLSLSPDERFSILGIVLSCALPTAEIPVEVRAQAESRGQYMGMLRVALTDAVRCWHQEEDWLTETAPSQRLQHRIELERTLGFIPWLKLSASRVKKLDAEPLLREFLQALTLFDSDRAAKVLGKQLEELPGDLELGVQRAYLELISGEVERAEGRLRNLLTEPGAESFAPIYYQRGMIALAAGKFELAIEQLKRAHNFSNHQTPLYYQTLTDLSWVLLQLGRVSEAETIAEQSVNDSVCPVASRLNFVSALLAGGKMDRAQVVAKQLFQLAPLDRRVFALLDYLR